MQEVMTRSGVSETHPLRKAARVGVQRRRARRTTIMTAMTAAAAFLLNPFLACGLMDEGEDFQYGAPEMRAAVEGTWRAVLLFDDGQQAEVTLTLAQAMTTDATASAAPQSGGALATKGQRFPAGDSTVGTFSTLRPGHSAARSPVARSLIRRAAACDNRTLVRAAGACASSTIMPLSGTVTAGEAAYGDGAVSGRLRVYGLAFTTGDLQVQLGERVAITATLFPNGTATTVALSAPGDGRRVGTGTLVRQTGP